MKKTLSQFKRLPIGTKVVMTEENLGFSHSGKLIGVERVISGVQTNGFYLKIEGTEGRGSFLEFPPASRLEYEGNKVTTFKPKQITLKELGLTWGESREKGYNPYGTFEEGFIYEHKQKGEWELKYEIIS